MSETPTSPYREAKASTAQGAFGQTVEIGPHRFPADEPPANGGNDAWHHRQHDVWGVLLDSVRLHTHPHITGTGTRVIEESGRRAIAELFERSFGRA